MRKPAKRLPLPAPDIHPRRGQIWRANLNPVIGSEIEKNDRPVLVLQIPGVGFRTVRICAPITEFDPEKDALRFWRVPIYHAPESGLDKFSCADASQVRALDIRRFIDHIGEAHPAEIDTAAAALATIVGVIAALSPEGEAGAKPR